nr:MAG TPA: hypothetical protein [Caudoviricetes sp.]
MGGVPQFLSENHKTRRVYGICASFFEKMCYTG